jgi:L-cysteine S-thiosulfotransferase
MKKKTAWLFIATPMIFGSQILPAYADMAADEDKKFEAYREAMADFNPGDFWIEDGEELFHEKRGPNNVSLEQCDLGLGPGVVKGAYAQLPRYFKDTNRVETLEGRLLGCMVKQQGFKEEEITKPYYHSLAEEDGTKSDLVKLVAYVASQSNGQPYRVKLENEAEKKSYEMGKYAFYHRMGSMDLACASCHATPGLLLRGVHLPVMTDPATAGKVMTAFPAYVIKDANVRTWFWRNERCLLAMRLPFLKVNSDLDVALHLFQVMEASKSDTPIAVPGIKPRA